MRVPASEHTSRPWRIHEVTPDFRVEDVWAYRTPGAGPDDFPDMLTALRAAGGLNENPPVVRFLFAVRWKLGAVLGWDTREQGVVGRVESLYDRLPPDLRQDVAGTAIPYTPFSMVYELPDECAIELANKTVHDICHLGWVPTDNGEYELRMAALVKPNGRLGRLYMAAIKPLRYLVVYPALTRKWERAWRDRDRYLAPGAPRAETPRAAAQTPAESRVVAWAGRLIVLFGTAHTLGALTVEGAGKHAGAWFSRELWVEDLADMSPAMSAYWLSVNSFGPPLILVGLTVLWLDRRGVTPPPFIAWSLGTWAVVDLLLSGPGVGQGLIILLACGMLEAGTRRAVRADHSTSPEARHTAGRDNLPGHHS